MLPASDIPASSLDWNADEIDELCGLLSLNTPMRDIARRFGRSQEAIRTKARNLGRVPA